MARYIRFELAAGERSYGEIEGDTIWPIEGGLFGDRRRSGEPRAFNGLKLLPPCEPSKLIGVGLNYRSHLGGRPLPPTPQLFYKPLSSLIGDGDDIVLPRDAVDVHFEGELVVIAGKTLKNAGRDEAAAAIFGVTCGNDVSDRNWQRGEGKDSQWWRAKGCDTFAPLGPAIATDLDPGNLLLRTRVNGRVAQEESTADLVHDCASILSWASQWITILPGDVIYTGTPGSTFALKAGDAVEVEIEGVGVLRNEVRDGRL